MSARDFMGADNARLGFCVNPAAIEHDFRGVWKWFSCYSGMKNVAFKHENRGFRV